MAWRLALLLLLYALVPWLIRIGRQNRLRSISTGTDLKFITDPPIRHHHPKGAIE